MNLDELTSVTKTLPELKSYAEIAEFWDTHSTADYWDEMETVEFEIVPEARRRYLIAVDPGLLKRAQHIARQRGLSTESLINLFLEQHLRQLELEAA